MLQNRSNCFAKNIVVEHKCCHGVLGRCQVTYLVFSVMLQGCLARAGNEHCGGEQQKIVGAQERSCVLEIKGTLA
jgi:hypothetical protein